MTYIRGSNFANRRLKDVLPRLIKGIHVFSQKLCDILLMGPMQSFSNREKAVEYSNLSIETTLFEQLHHHILPLYELLYEQEDMQHSQKLIEFATISPAHLGIEKKFWLLADSTIQNSNLPPYHKAIQTLKTIKTVTSPKAKVFVLKATADAICDCVLEYWKGRMDPKKLRIGGDEILPLFTYVIVKANVPKLYSESKLMEDFLSDSDLLGELGYMLVTFQTALSYICCMNLNECEQSVKDLFETIEQRKVQVEKKPPRQDPSFSNHTLKARALKSSKIEAAENNHNDAEPQLMTCKEEVKSLPDLNNSPIQASKNTKKP